MVANHDTASKSKVELPAEFTVQICSTDGRLLSEYRLTKRKDNVGTLAAAKEQALTDLTSNNDEQLVIVVSEETVGRLKQVQLQVMPSVNEET